MVYVRKGDGRARKPKGAQNKVTVELKTMILDALDKAGGVDYLNRDDRTGAQLDLYRDSKDEILHFFAVHRLAGEKVAIIRPAVVEVEKPERTAPGEKETLLLREPCPQEVAFQRRAGFRVFPVHGRRG